MHFRKRNCLTFEKKSCLNSTALILNYIFVGFFNFIRHCKGDADELLQIRRLDLKKSMVARRSLLSSFITPKSAEKKFQIGKLKLRRNFEKPDMECKRLLYDG